jgi:hypothetical protein
MKTAIQGARLIIQVLFGALPATILVLPFLVGHIVGMFSLGVGGVLDHRELFLHGLAMLCGAAGTWLTIAQQLDEAIMIRPFWHYALAAMLSLGLLEFGFLFLVLSSALLEEGRGAIVLLLPLATIAVMIWQLSMQVRGLKSRRRLTTP